MVDKTKKYQNTSIMNKDKKQKTLSPDSYRENKRLFVACLFFYKQNLSISQFLKSTIKSTQQAYEYQNKFQLAKKYYQAVNSCLLVPVSILHLKFFCYE